MQCIISYHVVGEKTEKRANYFNLHILFCITIYHCKNNLKHMLVGEWTFVATANAVNSDIQRRSSKKEKEQGWLLGAKKWPELSLFGK